MTSALILATESDLPYRVLRCTAPLFKRVYVLGTSKAEVFAHSRMCDGFIRHVDDDFGASDIDTVNHLCQKLAIDCVLPSDAATTYFLTGVRERLLVDTYPVPTTAAFRLLNNKGTFTALCSRLGVPIPATAMYRDSMELAVAAREGRRKFPFIVKPTCDSGGVGVVRVLSGNDLRNFAYRPVLAQDIVDGQEFAAFYFCRRGVIVAEIAYQHEDGAVVFATHSEIRGWAERIIDHLDFEGVIGFDVIERTDGSLAFLECNPRFWYNMNYCMLAGLNFVAIGVPVERAAKKRTVSAKRVPKLNC